MNDHELPFSHNEPRLVLQRRRDTLYETEKAFTTRLDVSAMLDVVGRPIALSRSVVALVEQRIERFEDERFVFRRRSSFHLVLLSRGRLAAIDPDDLTGDVVHLVGSQKHDCLSDLFRLSS